MSYFDKYLKYKAKYLKLKSQIGGEYTNLQYLGQGAESIVYGMKDGFALKVIKDPSKRISDEERDIMQKLSDLKSPYFPQIKAFGNCKNNIQLDERTTRFCVVEKEKEETDYQYIVMEIINGKDMMTIFYETFKDYANNERLDLTNLEFARKINDFSNYFIEIIKKIVDGLILANKEYKFRHGDFDFRNCLIKEDGTPVIIDFGSSTIGDKSKDSPECKDITAYIRSILNANYCNRKQDLEKIYKINMDENEPLLKLCVTNCKLILNSIKQNDKIKELIRIIDNCVPYLGRDITLDKLKDDIGRI